LEELTQRRVDVAVVEEVVGEFLEEVELVEVES
jgi:hypothetical protein